MITALAGFYYTPPEIPRERKKRENVLDYDLDADYIYAAFVQAYGIDLTEVTLHWHKFQALLNALPEDTMMVKIMQFRSYEGNSKDPGYRDYMDLKAAWALPKKYTEEEQRKIDEFNSLFG